MAGRWRAGDWVDCWVRGWVCAVFPLFWIIAAYWDVQAGMQAGRRGGQGGAVGCETQDAARLALAFFRPMRCMGSWLLISAQQQLL